MQLNLKRPRLNNMLVRVVTAASLTLCSVASAETVKSNNDSFIVKPYIQMGNNSSATKEDAQELMWISRDANTKWTVETKVERSSRQSKVNDKETEYKPVSAAVSMKEIIKADGKPDYLYSCKIEKLPLNSTYKYRVLNTGKSVFEAEAHTRKSFDSSLTFVLFGDLAAKTEGQRKIAYQAYLAKPDFVVMPGDLVYQKGLYSEYLDKYFPVYNADSASIDGGVPLIRSILTVGLLGNHDVAGDGRTPYTDFKHNPDALAYYYLWSEPLNGPTKVEQKSATPIGGNVKLEAAFKATAGEKYPAMGNFSFDYGNTHWLILDGNGYSDWSSPAMRKFVEDDLKKAQKSTWRFVTFHQPGFSIDKEHADEQHMRLLSPIFERQKVDIVFCGHAHDYQRTYPLTFTGTGNNGIGVLNQNGTVDGKISVDKTFDGKKNTHPHAPIYIVSGGGGATLYPLKLVPSELENFMDKVYAEKHSLTKCDINDKKLVFHQISEDGNELDKFEISK